MGKAKKRPPNMLVFLKGLLLAFAVYLPGLLLGAMTEGGRAAQRNAVCRSVCGCINGGRDPVLGRGGCLDGPRRDPAALCSGGRPAGRIIRGRPEAEEKTENGVTVIIHKI